MENKEALLALYADDCTIILEYSDSNLRAVLGILQEFFLLSGLIIQIEKTQASIIGVPFHEN